MDSIFHSSFLSQLSSLAVKAHKVTLVYSKSNSRHYFLLPVVAAPSLGSGLIGCFLLRGSENWLRCVF